MELLVDIGNSRIKWCTPEALQAPAASAANTDLPKLLAADWRALARPAKVWVASVAKEDVINTLTDWIRDTWQLTPVLAQTRPSELDLINGYDNPTRLGVDRWMALLGARTVTKTACVVVDCGTATTIDSLDPHGRHLGGVIVPGIELMRGALLRHTAIPPLAPSLICSPFAKDTASGIESGAVLATGCLINSVAKRLQERIGQRVVCILTGGAAYLLDGLLEMDVGHEPNLVLKGLARVAAQTTDT